VATSADEVLRARRMPAPVVRKDDQALAALPGHSIDGSGPRLMRRRSVGSDFGQAVHVRKSSA
jgi:hypothetical protein